jgi:hypothetical protein
MVIYPEMGLRGAELEKMLTLGCVRINSPRDASSVYPFTPEPVERTRLAEEPYLQSLIKTDGTRKE